MSGPFPGALIDYREGEGVTAGVVLAEEKGRLLVVSDRGREERIAPSRVALVVGRAHPAGRPPSAAEAARSAADHARRAGLAAGGVDLETLWELLVDEGKGRTLGELAALGLSRDDGESRGAVLRALLADRLRFQRKDEEWLPRSREAVADLLHQRERERERAAARERFVQRAKARLAGKPFEEPWSEGEEAVWRSLASLAIEGPAAPAAKGAPAILSELGIAWHTEEEGAFRVGLALGRFEPDENLVLRRFALATRFPAEVEEAARAAGERLPAILARGGRLDLRDEAAYTIDDAETRELDDALSVAVEPDGGLRVGIHVADPSSFIEPGDPLDREAESRVTSHYLPDLRIPMLPPVLSEGAGSLVAGEDRPALSFFVTFSAEGERLSSRIASSIIRVRRRLTYDEVTRVLSGDSFDPTREGATDRTDRGEGPSAPQDESAAQEAGLDRTDPAAASALRSLWGVALRLEAERLAAGAVRISAPEIEARPLPDGTLELQRLEPDRPGRRLVAEMMVLANSIAAALCLEAGIPALYRRQAPPDEPVPPLPVDSYDPLAVRRARRAMKRGEVSPTPGPHAGLGLRAYVQATSPLRRYQDLVLHRQLTAHLAGRPLPYDREAIARIAATTEEAERQARLVERTRRDYWLLRWLEQRTGATMEAVVLDTNVRRSEVELSETLLGASIPARPAHAPGRTVSVRIESVVPRATLLTLREIG